MTLEQLSYLSQTIAAFAVVASLVYAALEFRVYATSAQEARFATTIADIQEFRKILATDADCARIYRDGLADMNKLDSVEQWRFGALMQLVTTNFSYGMKFGDVIEAARLQSNIRSTMQRPGARQWWEKSRSTVDLATAEVIDAALNPDAPRGDAYKRNED
ncbi:MAG: hypothetical protein DCF16_11680 [Alphaproteobacteria bacterium]|nr:MAG: hypothetical protein DCF16_11680 [Alphaproteobacteria bacterium]